MSEMERKRIYDDMKTICDDFPQIKQTCEENKETLRKITEKLLNITERYLFEPKKGKVFNDSIHGHIELHPLLVKIIDTPQFQRLRNIKQLGGKYLIYPGASHNRFEHSLGVAHLAGRLLKSLQTKQPELNITMSDILCVEIAGLCHDLGHGPLSHLFDGLFIPQATTYEGWPPEDRDNLKKWKHEEMSVKIIKDIVKTLKEENENVLTEHGLDDNHVKFIAELIEGNIHENFSEEKTFLFEIVSNKQNGIDVDKWDYFARDSHHLGISNSFDHVRLLNFARVCKVDGKNHICFRDKEADNIYDMFRTRYTLHRQAYQHKTGNIIENMFTQALLKADRDLHKDKPEDMFTISKTIIYTTVDDYIRLTDEIFEKILSSSSENLKEAQDILKNIAKRRLPRFVGEARLTEENKSKIGTDQRTHLKDTLEQKWNEAKDNYKPTGSDVSLKDKQFSVYVVDLDHGLKGKNPIDYIYLYSKWDHNTVFKAKKYQVSSLLPNTFNEELVRVYCENPNVDEKVLKKAVKCFQEWCDSDFGFNTP